MKEVDVLIIYELKNRELENCALLSAELKRRGLTSLVLYNYSEPIRKKIISKVVIAPHLYDNHHLFFYASNREGVCRNVISLQYEQILTEGTESDMHNPSGEAMYAQHIAWGNAQLERYINHGISPEHVHVTGSISMDLLRPEFQLYFQTKKQVAERLNLDPSKEWVLFVSSFSFVGMPEETLKIMAENDPDVFEFSRISNDSFITIVDWLKKASISNPDKYFIYRKHPAEKLSKELLKIEKEISNFRCIDDFSMRQWALISDKIYNWYSTSLSDMYFAHKSCYILRPISIPSKMEVAIMAGASFVRNYNDFLSSLHNKDYFFPVEESTVKHFYINSDKGKMAFEKTVDLCVKMIENPQMGYDYSLKGNINFTSCIKSLYDTILYYYGKKYRTPQWFIKQLSRIPFLKMKTALKLNTLNNELYDADRLYKEYYKRFILVLEQIHQHD